eukprot:m.457482 g.457482  ORF g.457482 m.457482 type:complete len:169 (+) comp21579_c0_seq2:1598-2104(+)
MAAHRTNALVLNNPWHAMEDILDAFQAYSVFDIATRRARVVVADVPVGANVDDYMGVWIDFWNSAFSYRDLCIACGIVSALRPCTHSGRHLWANRTTHSNTVCTCRQRHPVTSLHTLVLDAATLSQAVCGFHRCNAYREVYPGQSPEGPSRLLCRVLVVFKSTPRVYI